MTHNCTVKGSDTDDKNGDTTNDGDRVSCMSVALNEDNENLDCSSCDCDDDDTVNCDGDRMFTEGKYWNDAGVCESDMNVCGMACVCFSECNKSKKNEGNWVESVILGTETSGMVDSWDDGNDDSRDNCGNGGGISDNSCELGWRVSGAIAVISAFTVGSIWIKTSRAFGLMWLLMNCTLSPVELLVWVKFGFNWLLS